MRWRLYGEDTLGALGAVEAEVRRTLRWLQEERPVYWAEQIKRRREQVSAARAEVFKKNLQKRADYNPPMSEQKENLRKAEVSLQDAEKRLAAVRKWQPLFKQAVLEYHASIQRIKDLSAADVPRAVNVLTRMIDALEVVSPRRPAVGARRRSLARPPAPARRWPSRRRRSTRSRPRSLMKMMRPLATRPRLANLPGPIPATEAQAPDIDADGALDPEPSSDGEAADG